MGVLVGLRFFKSVVLCSCAVVLAGGKTPEVNARGYTQIMKEQLLRGEENEVSVKVLQKVSKKYVIFFYYKH